MMGADPRLVSFAPIVDARTRLLILGSLPGEASLAAGRYYANPRNAFWRLMGGVLDEPLADMAYEDRLARLMARGVGLWDVVASAERRGSLDATIRAARPADLAGLVAGLPHLWAIAFNGATAARIGRRSLAGRTGARLIDLPSSSPAHARPFDVKRAAWIVLRDAL